MNLDSSPLARPTENPLSPPLPTAGPLALEGVLPTSRRSMTSPAASFPGRSYRIPCPTDQGLMPARAFLLACRRCGVLPSDRLLVVSVAEQVVEVWQRPAASDRNARPWDFARTQRLRASTSRFGIGNRQDSNRTPLGLHRIARKQGEGWPIGAVWKHRIHRGWTWQGQPDAPIAHRILWLEGLEPGVNRGPGIDSFRRYIYIHGVGDELTLGRPASHGCIHLAASDLLPLSRLLPLSTLVWITASPLDQIPLCRPYSAACSLRSFGRGLL